MKKIIYIFTFILISLSLSAQGVDRLMADYSKLPHVENVNLRKFLFSILKSVIPKDKESSNILHKISSIRVIDLSACSTSDKTRFVESVENLKDTNYELLMKVKDDEDNVLIYSKSKKNKIREFVIICCENKDPVIVKLKGKFSLDDLPGVNKEYGEGKKKKKTA